MDQSNSTVAQQIAQAASTFGPKRTGYAAKSVTVVVSEGMRAGTVIASAVATP